MTDSCQQVVSGVCLCDCAVMTDSCQQVVSGVCDCVTVRL